MTKKQSEKMRKGECAGFFSSAELDSNVEFLRKEGRKEGAPKRGEGLFAVLSDGLPRRAT